MKYRFCLFIFLWLSLTACQSTISPPRWRWERAETGLPRQAMMLAVTADPLDPARLWVGYYAPGGLAASVDGGQTWSTGAAGLADNPVFGLLALPHQGVWAATPDGLFWNADKGVNWQPVRDGLPQVTAFALAADAAERVYVGFEQGGVYVQTPDSAAWQSLVQADSPLALSGVIALEVSPDGKFIYAGTAGQGIFASQDGGQTWMGAYPHEYAANIAVNPAHPSQAVASLREEQIKDDVLAMRLENLDTWNKLMRTDDGGRSWHPLPLTWADDQVTSLLWLPDGTLGAGTGKGQLFRSHDGGDTWQSGGVGLPSDGILDLTIAGKRFLAATWTGLYASDDGGQTWTNLAPALGMVYPQALLTTNQGVLLGARTGLYRWQPDSHTWTPLPAGISTGVTALTYDPKNSQRIYLGTAGEGVYTSEDGGSTWRKLPALGVSLAELAVDPRQPAHLYGLAAWERPYQSLDGGQTWMARWSGLGDVLETTSLAVDPTQPIVYVGTETGLYRSYDNDDWLIAAPALVDQSVLALLAQPATTSSGGNTVLYIGATRGVYRSLDGGLTTQGSADDPAWGQGLENISVTALLADPHNPQRLYAGAAYHGVYQSLDGGYTWQSLGSPAALTDDVIKALAWGPNGELFVAAVNGVWRALCQGE